MDEALWNLFWTTGLPEAYTLAKETVREMEETQEAQADFSA